MDSISEIIGEIGVGAGDSGADGVFRGNQRAPAAQGERDRECKKSVINMHVGAWVR